MIVTFTAGLYLARMEGRLNEKSTALSHDFSGFKETLNAKVESVTKEVGATMAGVKETVTKEVDAKLFG